MHPSRDKIKSFVEGGLDGFSHKKVGRHIDNCELCREFCDDYRLLVDSLAKARLEDVPPEARELADELYYNALQAQNIIPLLPLAASDIDSDAEFLLAADDRDKSVPAIKNLVTLYSEDPEVILRVMRDSEKETDYLQLISDNSKLVSFVMIKIPELDKEYITDEVGHVALKGGPLEKYDNLNWQIKLPDSMFDLKPFQYDPDKVEYSKEVLLETENHDKVRILFEGKTEGKQITLKIIEINGKTDFGNTKVVISQRKKSRLYDSETGGPLSFDLSDSDDNIKIRLFY